VSSSLGGGEPFEFRTRVRFHQADPAGVLFFGRVFELVSDAYEELIRLAFLRFEDVFRAREFLVPIVHAEADYRRPIWVGEQVTLRLEIQRIGRSSLTYGFEVLDDSGELRVRGRIVHAFVDSSSFETIEIPPHVRQQLETLASRQPARSAQSSPDASG
jgi:YbgC/YbaW family acyl-CoA thioester hydrolase